jgi:O-antigen ligase
MILLLCTVLAAATAVAWLVPWAAVAFVINGSVVYYATLGLLNVPPSAQLTGAILGVPAGVAALRLMTRSGAASRVARNPGLYLFSMFALIWYARWLIDPAPSTGFGGRALAYMFVFAILPFISGLLIRESEIREALWWLFGFGAAGVVVMLGYWIGGGATFSTNFTGRWEPIPYVPGAVIAIDLGVACLSLFALFPTSRTIVAVLSGLLTLFVVAIDIRLGSRGPFLLLIACLCVCIAVVLKRAGAREALIRGAGLLVVLALAYGLASPAAAVAPPPVSSGSPEQPATNPVPRVAQADSYLSPQDPSTKERLEIFEAALGFIAQRPIFGWGGGLVGRDINGHLWDYAHNTFLDPLVETGVIGAIPYWTLFVLITLSLVEAIRRKAAVLHTLLPLFPLFAFALLESLISGHVANSRQMWLFVGITCGLLVRSTGAARVAVARRPSVALRQRGPDRSPPTSGT